MVVDSNYFPSSHSAALAKSAASFGVSDITETFTRRVHYNIAAHCIRPQKGTGLVDDEGFPILGSQHFFKHWYNNQNET